MLYEKILQAICVMAEASQTKHKNIIVKLKLMKDNHIINKNIMSKNSNNNKIKPKHHQIQV